MFSDWEPSTYVSNFCTHYMKIAQQDTSVYRTLSLRVNRVRNLTQHNICENKMFPLEFHSASWTFWSGIFREKKMFSTNSHEFRRMSMNVEEFLQIYSNDEKISQPLGVHSVDSTSSVMWMIILYEWIKLFFSFLN